MPLYGESGENPELSRSRMGSVSAEDSGRKEETRGTEPEHRMNLFFPLRRTGRKGICPCAAGQMPVRAFFYCAGQERK